MANEQSKEKQIELLIKKNAELVKRNLELLEQLSEITSSRFWRLLYIIKNPMLIIEKSFFKIFPHWLIPQPIKEKLKQIINLEKTKEKDFNFRLKRILRKGKKHKADVIIYSVIAWGYRFQRPQQLATQFRKKGYRVWYIKNEFIISSMFAPNKHPKIYKVAEDIYEVTLPSRSPLFIYTDQLNERNALLMEKALRTLIEALKMKNIIQIVDHPFWANLSIRLPFPIIYDCMDDHQSFEMGGKKNESERKIVTKADYVVTTSSYLQGKIKQFNKKNVLIGNACDYEHFSKKGVQKNKLISRLKKPIIGYYGALAEWFDKEIVEAAVKNHPSWNFVFIGAVSDRPIMDLKKYSNVHFLGEKPYSSLPSFLSGMDVCIIPFKLTPLIKATDPVKFYEMLAAGKPVVATKIPELSNYKEPMLYIVDQKHGLDEQIKKALKENTVQAKIQRRKIAEDSTWEKRAERFLKIIDDVYPKVSIVIVSYKNWQLTENCLKSLEDDGYPNKEIIVVDNMSDDETRVKLRELRKQKKIIAILNKKNFGFAKGNNIGIKKATGEYIALLNNDVEVTPLWIQNMIKHLKDDDSIGLIGAITNESGNESRIRIKGSKPRILKVGKKYANEHLDELFDIRVLPAQCWFMKKKEMDKVGRLDERFGIGLFEDDDYCERVRRSGKRVVCAEDVFIYHKGKASFNLLEDESYKTLFNKNRKKFEKKWKIKWTPHKYRKMKSL